MNTEIALVTSPNCYLRSAPGAGIEDELFSGWAVRIFPETEADGWVKIETHYGYTGYTETRQLRRIPEEELKSREDPARFFCVGLPAADLLDQPKVQGQPLEVLYKNAVVEKLDSAAPGQDAAPEGGTGPANGAAPTDSADPEAGWCRIRTAAGNEGYVHEKDLRVRLDDDGYLFLSAKPARPDSAREDSSPEQPAATADGYFLNHFRENPPEEETFRAGVVRSARAYLGVQYRWGGKSVLGLDCSGLAFMSYLENGVLIWRDASMQPGYPVQPVSREVLRPGDLIYFPGHVAIYLGEQRYIHSTGYEKTPCVTINSLNPADADYRADLPEKITGYGSVFPPTAARSACSAQRTQPQAEAAAPGAYSWTGSGQEKLSGSVWEDLRQRLDAMPGSVSVVYKNLAAGETFTYRAQEQHNAASVIKLFLMAAVFQGFEDGRFAPTDRIPVHRSDCVPSCGVLTYLQGEREVSVRDLVELMIIVSDNTACNLLFDLVGEENLAAYMKDSLHLTQTVFRRKMFDSARAAQGIENKVTAEDAAWLLEQIYRGKLVSEQASKEMYEILTHQRLNGKIPFYLHTLPDAPVIAHKTGEDTGVTHDVAVIEGKEPFLLCFLGSETDVPAYERLMAETALKLYTEIEKK